MTTVLREVFTVPQLARRWSRSDRTIRRWLIAGVLRGTKIGHDWRIAKAVVEQAEVTGVPTRVETW